MTQGQVQPTVQTTNNFNVLKWLEIKVHDVRSMWNPSLVLINTFRGTYPALCRLVSSLSTFLLQGRDTEFQEALHPAEPRVFTLRPFVEKQVQC